MELEYFSTTLSNNLEAIQGLIRGVSTEQARWKPDAESWSVLEVINHLYDEEREDFRQRLDFLLHKPGEVWPPIDPQGWVSERQYNTRDWAASWGQFAAEREHSIAWLRGLAAPDWDATYAHPQAGSIRAADLLHAWVAHDFLHTRQLVELRYLYHAEQAQPYSVAYAGEW